MPTNGTFAPTPATSQKIQVQIQLVVRHGLQMHCFSKVPSAEQRCAVSDACPGFPILLYALGRRSRALHIWVSNANQSIFCRIVSKSTRVQPHHDHDHDHYHDHTMITTTNTTTTTITTAITITATISLPFVWVGSSRVGSGRVGLVWVGSGRVGSGRVGSVGSGRSARLGSRRGRVGVGSP